MAKKQNLKSLVSGVLETGEAPSAHEVERHVGEMAPAPVASTVLKLPLDRIYPDPDQPRRTFPEDSLEELAASIREQGVLEPIQVIATDEGYQLLHGERRWRAAEMAGLSWIPSIIYERSLSDADRLTRQLIENIQREDLNDVDRAAALERLKDLLDATWDEVAEKVGLTVGRIHQLRRLSRLAPEIQDAVKTGGLSEKDSRPYQGLSQEQQLALYRASREESLPSDMVKKVARRLKKGEEEEGITHAIQQIRLEQERAQARPQPRGELVEPPPAPEAAPTSPGPPPPTREETAGVPVEGRQSPERPAETREPVTKETAISVPPAEKAAAPQVAKAVPEEHAPYEDVETDRLLDFLNHIVEDTSQQLNLVVQALRRRPLASWEQERVADALSQLQESLIELRQNEHDGSPEN